MTLLGGPLTKEDRSMDKPSVFIGSSSEGIATARAIKEQFSKEAVVDVWDENVFQQNKSYLESLLRAANMYEFGILVYTKDDKTTSRGKAHRTPRDNVLFEHGLLLGRLGPNRAFFVCEKGVKIPSDFDGIFRTEYERPEDGNLRSAVGDACNKIRIAMQRELERSEISLLPSTALAIGYYKNFVDKVVPELQRYRGKSASESPIKKVIVNPMSEGHEKKEETVPVVYEDFILQILIPENMAELSKGLIDTLYGYIRISLHTPQRIFPFYIRKSEAMNQMPEILELVGHLPRNVPFMRAAPAA